MIKQGFKFGLMLQLAIGPICFFIFYQACERGLVPALIAVLGVVCIDSLYILLSIWGVSKLLKDKENLFKYIGAAVLMVFGLKIILGSFTSGSSAYGDINNELSLFKVFMTSIFLTGSNPLTILFWMGVFSSKLSQGNYQLKDRLKFGSGAVMATGIFLSMIAFMGQFTTVFLSTQGLIVLNILAGVFILGYGIKMIIPKRRVEAHESHSERLD